MFVTQRFTRECGIAEPRNRGLKASEPLDADAKSARRQT
jgi:hypothetical protein